MEEIEEERNVEIETDSLLLEGHGYGNTRVMVQGQLLDCFGNWQIESSKIGTSNHFNRIWYYQLLRFYLVGIIIIWLFKVTLWLHSDERWP